MRHHATHRNATQRNVTQRNATQRTASQRTATQPQHNHRCSTTQRQRLAYKLVPCGQAVPDLAQPGGRIYRTHPRALPSDWSSVEAKRTSAPPAVRRQVGHLNLHPVPTFLKKPMHLRRERQTNKGNKAHEHDDGKTKVHLVASANLEAKQGGRPKAFGHNSRDRTTDTIARAHKTQRTLIMSLNVRCWKDCCTNRGKRNHAAREVEGCLTFFQVWLMMCWPLPIKERHGYLGQHCPKFLIWDNTRTSAQWCPIGLT